MNRHDLIASILFLSTGLAAIIGGAVLALISAFV